MAISLSGVDPNDPTPGFRREYRPNSGIAGGASGQRAAVILCNKLSTVGSGSVDGKGDALEAPVLLDGSEQDVIDRCGRKSEALVLWKTFQDHNRGVTPCYLLISPPGSGSATCDFTVATTATARGVIRISVLGENFDVGVESGDTVSTIATNLRAKINSDQMRYVPLVASGSTGTVTITASWAGSRGDHYVNKIRITVITTGLGTTVTKGSVTAGSTDDDQTNAIASLELAGAYYQVTPKVNTSAASSTDNGLGEHNAALVDWVSPQKNKNQILISGSVGTPTQSTAIAIGLNQVWDYVVASEGSDWSPGMLAAMFAGILSYAETSDKAPNLADYGRKRSTDVIKAPAPFSVGDRPTAAEIKTMLNNGVTPIAFTPAGKPYIVWYVTTKSITNSVTDYRGRPGHLPSVMFYVGDTLAADVASIQQDRIADDPKEGEKPILGVTTPRDIKGSIDRTIDALSGANGDLPVLDPSQVAQMKAASFAERATVGWNASVNVAAVRHNLKQGLLINEVSPSI